MAKRILITGAGGFVGANLAHRCLLEHHEVHLLLRPGGDDWRIQDLAGRVGIHCVAVEDVARVRAVVTTARPQWVFHLAAYGAYAHQTDMARMVGTNVLGCVSVLDACVDAGVEAFIQTGTSSEYGYRSTPATEDAALQPNSRYAISKAAATHYCQLVTGAHPINATIGRLYSVYGPFEEPTRLVPTLLVHALAGRLPPLVAPGIARDFIYVDDAVDALLSLAQAPEAARGSVYNVCTGAQTTLQEIVSRVRELLNVEAEPVWGTMPARPWDTATWSGSPEKMAREIGWRSQTRLSTGLAKTVAWLRGEPDRLKFYQDRMPRLGAAR